MAEDKENSYLAELYKAYHYSKSSFDKSLTFIASGMLAISFAFIEKIITLNTAKSKDILINGWIILAIAIFLSVLAHYAEINLLKLVIQYFNEKDNKKQKWIRSIGDFVIEIINILTLVLILIGSINIIFFIKINI